MRNKLLIMNNKAALFTIFLSIFSSLLLLSSCKKDKDNSTAKTLLIYMAANNNLSSSAATDLEEIKNGYVPNYFSQGEKGKALLVYYHVSGSTPKMLRIYKDPAGTIVQETIHEYEAQNSCTDSVVNQVINYAFSLFPGEEQGLILWSHGTGWLPVGFYSNPVENAISHDGNIIMAPAPPIIDPDAHLVKNNDASSFSSKSFGSENGVEIDIMALERAIPFRLDYIFFDACLMGSVEVAYELKDKCDYLIASAAEILVDSSPYDLITESIFKPNTADLQGVCESFYNYYNEMTGNKRSATISLINTSALPTLASACKTIFNNGGREKIANLDMTQIQGFFRNGRHWFYDLEDFMKQIADPSDTTALVSAFNSAVLYRAATPYFMESSPTGFKIDTHCGLTTYIPNPDNLYLDDYYRNLAWNGDAELFR